MRRHRSVQRLLAKASSAVGNSSSFVRDAGYFGTPVVLVGDRQEGRETDVHVIPVEPVANEIARVVGHQMAHGRYAPSTLYGDGHASARIAQHLSAAARVVQKRLAYVQAKT